MKLCFPILCLALALAPSMARADAAACLSNHERSQVLRKAGQLAEARAAAMQCTVDVCPSLVRSECAVWVDEITRDLPTLVVRVQNDDGCDLTEGTMSIGDRVVDRGLDGSAQEVSPGQHVVRVVRADGQVAEQRVVVREGEKNRRVDVYFGDPKRTCGGPAGGPLRTPLVEDEPVLTTPTIVVGSVGIASLVAGAVLVPVGFLRRADICETDGKNCDPSEIGSVRATQVAGDIAIGVGVAALGTALIIELARPSGDNASSLQALRRIGRWEW